MTSAVRSGRSFGLSAVVLIASVGGGALRKGRRRPVSLVHEQSP